MPESLFGLPQIVATLVLLQRGLEEIYSAINTRRLLAQGAREAGRDYYPVVAVTHLAWIASIYFLVPSGAAIFWPAAVAFLALQVARYWIIGSLGPCWTHRIIVNTGGEVVRRGPYRYVRHPNYIVTIAETLILPAAFGAFALGVIMAAVWAAVVLYKQRLEEATLAPRRATSPETSPSAQI